MKRCRQRVDAGEPRHSYQVGLIQQQLQHINDMAVVQSQIKMTPMRRDFHFNSLNNFIPTKSNQSQSPVDLKLRDDQLQLFGDVGLDSTNHHTEMEARVGGAENNERILTPHSDTPNFPSSQSGSRRKSFQPKRQGTASLGSSPSDLSALLLKDDERDHSPCLRNGGTSVDCLNALEAVDNTEGTDDGESRDGNQQTPEEDCAVDGKEKVEADSPAAESGSTINGGNNDDPTPNPVLSGTASLFPPLLPQGNKFQELFMENQRRFYSLLLEQQKKQQQQQQAAASLQLQGNTSLGNGAMGVNNPLGGDPSLAFNLYIMQQQHLQEIQRSFQKIGRELKEKLINSYSESMDRVVDESLDEAFKLVQTFYRQQFCEFQQQFSARQQQQQAGKMLSSGQQLPQANGIPPLMNMQASLPFSPSACNNFFAAAAAAFANNQNNPFAAAISKSCLFNGDVKGAVPGSIFPTLAQQMTGIGGLMPQNTHPSSLFPQLGSIYGGMGDDSPRKKRSKVTDSVRGPRSIARDTPNSHSGRSTPQLNNGGYFPPTMVSSRHLFLPGNGLLNDVPNGRAGSGNGSPGGSNSDGGGGGSDGGAEDGGPQQQRNNLTHVHLRKAKLMFFYTRYPSSTVLKSYFPDISFNKNNTAQLVKWFSNFREFFYMQMEKFAKQALAEGIRNKDEIFVAIDSEIYKQLNQHYNRNNIIHPPEQLRLVIQETLKEFFAAIQQGKDSEPSWKKVIYKVIQQMDDTIPHYFKDPDFIEKLEQAN